MLFNLAPCTLPFELVPLRPLPPPRQQRIAPLPIHHPLHVGILVCRHPVLVLQGSEQFVLP